MLYLRELVLEAAASGALHDERGSWRLHGSTRVPPRLVELIGARLAALDDAARSALDVLAVAERIDLDELTGLVDLDALERLEDAGLIEVVDEGAGPLVTFAHPLYGEAVRAAMPARAPPKRAADRRRRGRGGRDAATGRPRPCGHVAARRRTAGRSRAAHDRRPACLQRQRLRSSPSGSPPPHGRPVPASTPGSCSPRRG